MPDKRTPTLVEKVLTGQQHIYGLFASVAAALMQCIDRGILRKFKFVQYLARVDQIQPLNDSGTPLKEKIVGN